VSFIGHNIDIAAELLRRGEAIAIPTETVYGLAANALRIDAVAKIFRIKQRPTFDPLIVHVANIDQITNYVVEIPAPLRILAERFMPGPLTLLLEKKPNIPELVTSGSPYVAIRVPDHPLTLSLLQQLDFPLAAPSANPFGYISPTTAQHVADQLGNKLSYILDGGPCQVGIESTIVGMANGEIHIYRKGGLPIEVISEIVGHVHVRDHSSSQPDAPGMLTNHYAPSKPFVIVNTVDQIPRQENVGVLAFHKFVDGIDISKQIVLSMQGRFDEAAQNLFAGMRYLDNCPIDIIYAEMAPERDLGIAINDRLRRAAAK
jgi:L-threonylcarbamoyladenylate synthase